MFFRIFRMAADRGRQPPPRKLRRQSQARPGPPSGETSNTSRFPVRSISAAIRTGPPEAVRRRFFSTMGVKPGVWLVRMTKAGRLAEELAHQVVACLSRACSIL